MSLYVVINLLYFFFSFFLLKKIGMKIPQTFFYKFSSPRDWKSVKERNIFFSFFIFHSFNFHSSFYEK